MDNKSLVAKLAVKLGKSKADVTKLLEGFTQVITSCASELDSVAIPGFGTFEAVKHDEYVETNSSSGKRTLFPPHVEMNFTPSTVLKKKINTKNEK
jgi:DNA-binding protein HU-beta/integration host factor subunit alpha